MITFGAPIEAGPSSTGTSALANLRQNVKTEQQSSPALTLNRAPTPNAKRYSAYTPVEVNPIKEAIDDLLADIKHKGFTVPTNQTFPELEDAYMYRRPITPPEPVHLSTLTPDCLIRTASSNENRMKPVGLGPEYAPPVSYSTKPNVSKARSRSAETAVVGRRRTAAPPSEAWKRLGSSTYYFADDGRCVGR